MKVKRLLLSVTKWLAALVLLVGGVMAIRCFCVESYQISTASMEESLFKGDYILVNKLPGNSSPARGKVILFTSPLRKDTADTPLFLSRCIGMPGDTIRITREGYSINGRLLARSPRSLNVYFITKEVAGELQRAIHKLSIPLRGWQEQPFGYTFQLTTFEEYQLREELDEDTNRRFVTNQNEDYTLIVPVKGKAYHLDAAALTACKEAILRESDGKAVFRDNSLYLNGRETHFFFFKQDYYWMLSDNTNEAVDSRHLGFIPADHLIGNAWFCWLSKDKQRIFKPVH